jgi:hypothetical protein
MVDRLKKRLSVEVLEDRTLPSTTSVIFLLDAAGTVAEPPAPAKAATLFVGGAAATALQANKDIVAVGKAATSPAHKSGSTTASSSAPDVLALARFTPNGQLDTGFGTGGEVWTSIKASTSQVCGLTVQTDQQIVLTVATPVTSSITVARFDPDGSPDNTLTPDSVSSSPPPAAADGSVRDQASTSTMFISLNATGDLVLTFTPPPTQDSIGAPASGTVNNVPPAIVVSNQIPWTKGSDSGSSGGSVPVGRTLFPPVVAVPFRGSNSHPSTGGFSTAGLTQLAWTRTSDSLVAWNDYALTAPTLASLQLALALLEGSDSGLSGGGQTPASQVRPTLHSIADVPSYLRDSLVVAPISLAALPPADVPVADGPAMPAGAMGLPSYLLRTEAAADVAGDTAELAGARVVADTGLAAVDAAFLLIGAGENPGVDCEAAVLASETREQPPQPRRGMSWPLWFVVLVAASGGGAAWQGGGRIILGARRRGSPSIGNKRSPRMEPFVEGVLPR